MNEMIGEKYGNLRVNNIVEGVNNSRTLSLWQCYCDSCGGTTQKRGYELITGDALLSCGCDERVLSPSQIPLVQFLKGQSQEGLIAIVMELVDERHNSNTALSSLQLLKSNPTGKLI